ncbi:MAG: M20 family metallopeptidase [Candidatus Jettenia sp. CY-1]|nr:M20 family metallopeptidase [Candidatus Jettenia sp.]WKZ18621.1 MAG: M20 family metallopeptidase [Candidatus Jettenia sp. CY-1]
MGKYASDNSIHYVKEYMQNEENKIVELAVKLINKKTENPPGNEVLAVEVVEDFFKSLQIPYTIFEKVKHRTNIIGYIGRKEITSSTPTLLIACHLDVVPAGDDWKKDPFEAWIENGRIYGRGASDNKGQMAAMMAVARFLKENESKLKGRFLLIGVADEERGSTLGLEYLLNECGISADFAIIPDVAHNMQIIDVTEKGTLFLEIASHGKQAHGSRPEMGINAIWNMIILLDRIKQLKFRQTSHPLHSPPTLNLGSIHSGTAPNIVPALCKVQLDIRYLPGDSSDTIVNDIKNIIKEVEALCLARFDVKIISDQPPTAVPTDNLLVELISKHAQSILGTRPQPKGLSGATVTKQLIQKGIIAVGFGPGDVAEAHATNESIDIKELVDFAKIMALISLDILAQ